LCCDFAREPAQEHPATCGGQEHRRRHRHNRSRCTRAEQVKARLSPQPPQQQRKCMLGEHFVVPD
jgi:hypothetical protein